MVFLTRASNRKRHEFEEPPVIPEHPYMMQKLYMLWHIGTGLPQRFSCPHIGMAQTISIVDLGHRASYVGYLDLCRAPIPIAALCIHVSLCLIVLSSSLNIFFPSYEDPFCRDPRTSLSCENMFEVGHSFHEPYVREGKASTLAAKVNANKTEEVA